MISLGHMDTWQIERKRAAFHCLLNGYWIGVLRSEKSKRKSQTHLTATCGRQWTGKVVFWTKVQDSLALRSTLHSLFPLWECLRRRALWRPLHGCCNDGLGLEFLTCCDLNDKHLHRHYPHHFVDNTQVDTIQIDFISIHNISIYFILQRDQSISDDNSCHCMPSANICWWSRWTQK